jgi:hypothetical protein
VEATGAGGCFERVTDRRHRRQLSSGASLTRRSVSLLLVSEAAAPTATAWNNNLVSAHIILYFFCLLKDPCFLNQF